MVAIANMVTGLVKIYKYVALVYHPILLVSAPVSKPLYISLLLTLCHSSTGNNVVWHQVP